MPGRNQNRIPNMNTFSRSRNAESGPPEPPLPDVDLALILSPAQRQEFPAVSGYFRQQGFLLCGGTALAMYLGHRRSFDFDFMGDIPFNSEDVVSDLKSRKVNATIIRESYDRPRQLQLQVRGFKVEVTEARPLREGSILAHQMAEVPSLQELACMKTAAAARRGKKRDIVDLYFLTRKQFTPEALVEMTYERYRDNKRYGFTRDQIIKSIVDFQSKPTFNPDDPIDLVETCDWIPMRDVVLGEFSQI